jgi:putative ABC transport system substrate-binding protein
VFSGAATVRLGLVASLSRPGGNITGMSTLTTPLGAKSVALLKELLPSFRDRLSGESVNRAVNSN